MAKYRAVINFPVRPRVRSRVASDGVVFPVELADAHRGDGKRFFVRADEMLTAFVELESAVGAYGELP